MKKCNNFEELLALYADDVTLSYEEREKVEEHLDSCSLCQKELSRLKESFLIIKEVSEHAVPKNLHNHIMQGITKKENTKKKPYFFRRMVNNPLVAAAALFFFVILSGNIFLTSTSNILLERGPVKDMAMNESAESIENNDVGLLTEKEPELSVALENDGSQETYRSEIDVSSLDNSEEDGKLSNIFKFNMVGIPLGSIMLFLIWRKTRLL